MSKNFKEQVKAAMSNIVKEDEKPIVAAEVVKEDEKPIVAAEVVKDGVETVIMADENVSNLEKFSQHFIAIKPVIDNLINDIKNIVDSELAASAEGFSYNRTELHDYLKNYTDDNLFNDDKSIALMSKIANELDVYVASKYYFSETERLFKKRWQEEKERNTVESDKHFEDDINEMLDEF